MTLEEEVALLKEKRDLLLEIQALEAGKITRVDIPPYIWPNPTPWVPTYVPTTGEPNLWPTRLDTVDPFVREGMNQPCTFS